MIKIEKYIHKNFLLTNDLSRCLYHDVAKRLPIIDFHNHLDPLKIATDAHPENLSKLWVMGDQYKHRAMRINGISENGITGDVSDYEKYVNWAKTLPKTLGNPLHQWSYLEMKRIFDIDIVLNESSAKEIWDKCQSQISSCKLSTVSLLKKFNTEALCTSDDLLDDVSIHEKASKKGTLVIPSLRTDSILDQSENFKPWCDVLETMTNVTIKDLDSYVAALQVRFDVFEKAGCKLADQALDAGFEFNWVDGSKANVIFKQFLSGERLSDGEAIALKSHLLILIGNACAKRNWALQLHIGAQRKTSSKLKVQAGPSGGFAAIGSSTNIAILAEILDTMDNDGMPRIILYNLNPIDNAAFASLTGSFSETGVAGKIQFGPAWWYNDHYEGITNQLTALANHGLLFHSIGMTTDSRSFLSMSRHEYFRRVFCQWLSDWVKKGLVPNDTAVLQDVVQAVCYTNAKKWILNNEKY